MLADRGSAIDQVVLPDSVQALIAARLDTLTQERKSLLQDAAVLGKVFWTGALIKFGDRDPSEVELALHELARRELVRPARTSSMEGESEYSFGHLLVRDVAYGQIPRAERAHRHRAAAAWIEGKAGERVEDLAEVLAHHYLQALELSKAVGETERAAKLVAPARRFLALAGERALGLDVAQAEARLARALELTPSDDADRPERIVRWADAASQAGRLREAAEALDDALAHLRAGGEPEATARALQLRSRIALRLAEGSYVALAVEAVALLERESAGPALVDAYSQLANAHAIAGAYVDAIAAADRALALAAALALPELARAVGYRGFARAHLGDADGITEMVRALALLIDEGGRDVAAMQNNLALVRYARQGPARSLVGFEEGIAFCERRGQLEQAGALEANCPGLLAELGRTEEALAQAERLAAVFEARGDTRSLIEVRAVEIGIRLTCNRAGAGWAGSDWLIETARETGTADISVVALSCAAAALLVEAPERACAVLAELERTAGAHETPYYARQLGTMVRTALAAGDAVLAKRLADGVEPRTRLGEHALCAAHAQLADHRGDYGKAADLYAEAAARWQEFGNVPERAYALLGQGRCLLGLDLPGAEESLRESRRLFLSIGSKQALAEADALLEQTTGAPTS